MISRGSCQDNECFPDTQFQCGLFLFGRGVPIPNAHRRRQSYRTFQFDDRDGEWAYAARELGLRDTTSDRALISGSAFIFRHQSAQG